MDYKVFQKGRVQFYKAIQFFIGSIVCLAWIIAYKNIVFGANKAMMENGIILYGPIQDTAATTTTTWRTEGFTIKSKKTFGNPTKAPKGEIWLKDGEVKEKTMNGIRYVTFSFPEKKVIAQLKAAGVNAKTLKESGGFLYLNGIFQVYEEGKPTGEYYRTLKGIQRAREWSNSKDFDDRFDIEIKYSPSKQKVELIFQELNDGHLTDVSRKTAGEFLTHSFFKTDASMIPTTIKSKKTGKDYYLYRVHYKYPELSKSKIYGIERTLLNPSKAYDAYRQELRRLRNREIEVEQGGLWVVAFYRDVKEEVQKENFMEGEIETPNPEVLIEADQRGKELYEAEQGIPVTKSLYLNGSTQEYLLQYQFEQKKGEEHCKVTIHKNYNLRWTKTYAGAMGSVITVPCSATVPITKVYMIPRSYAYWEVKELNVYRINQMQIQNKAFPMIEEILYAKAETGKGIVYKKTTKHKIVPKPIKIKLPSQTIYGGSLRPSVPSEDWTSLAEKKVPEIKVSNDHVSFQGKKYMDSNRKETATDEPIPLPAFGKMTNRDLLYKSGVIIPVVRANGAYESEGTAIYERILAVGEKQAEKQLQYPVESINEITVHTPVVCEGKIEDVKKYNQMKNPNKAVSGIVLDREFQVTLKTVGEHRDIKGYGLRDYREFIKKSQVCFPFDVYQGNTYYEKGTWIDLVGSASFYLPTWVNEGLYSVEFRSVSINAPFHNGEQKREEYANICVENYTAFDRISVQVSGRIYGFRIRDISDYPLWQSVFRKKDSMKPTGIFYSVGTKNQNGEQIAQKELFTLPLFEQSYPSILGTGIMKAGYQIRFTIDTIGNMSEKQDYVRICPKFYYITKDGKQRKEADVYYSETVNGKKYNFVKMGSQFDQQNKKRYKLSEPYFSVPEQEYKKVCQYLGLSLEQWKDWEKPISTYLNVMIPDSMRTFIGKIKRGNVTVSERKVGMSMQRWYGQYSIPSQIYVTEKGTDLLAYAKKYGINKNSKVWLKKGYLLVQFEIETIQNGVIHLSYLNKENEKQGYCNMWKMEGYSYQKRTKKGEKVSFEDGDVWVYDLEKSVARDYEIGGTH